MSDPTQTGGQEDPKPTPNARNNAMAQIAQQAHAQQVDDLAGFNEDTGEIENKTERVEPAAEVVAEAQPAVQTKKYALIVDGKTIEKDESEVIEAGKRALQKESAADKRLQEATELKRKWEEIQRSPQRTQEPSQDAPTAQAISQETLPTLVQGLKQEVFHEVVTTLTAQEAVKKFREEFQDIATDPDLWLIAINRNQQRIDHAAAVGEPLGDDLSAYRKIGTELRERFVPKTTKVPEQLQDKAERKRTITSIQAVNAAAPSPQEKKPLSTPEQIEEMRKMRAQGYRTQGFQRLKT